MPRQVSTEPPFFGVVFHVSVAEPFLMAEVPVLILLDVLVAGLPAAEAAAEVPAAGDNLVAPAEEVPPTTAFLCRWRSYTISPTVQRFFATWSLVWM